MPDDNIIFFDGVCNLCNSAVNFVVERDPEGYYKLAPLQSDIAKKFLGEEKVKKLDSIVLYQNGNIYEKSSAALRITKNLSGAWSALYPLIITPRFIRDFFYDVIAKNRYKWFGKRETCRMATPDLKDRFLE